MTRVRAAKRQWSAKKVSQVTTLSLLGYRSTEIAAILGDGTSAESIRHQLDNWGVFDKAAGDGMKRIPVRMHPRAVADAKKLAEQMGIPMEVWAGRIIEFAAKGGLYDAIVDGDGSAYEG